MSINITTDPIPVSYKFPNDIQKTCINTYAFKASFKALFTTHEKVVQDINKLQKNLNDSLNDSQNVKNIQNKFPPIQINDPDVLVALKEYDKSLLSNKNTWKTYFNTLPKLCRNALFTFMLNIRSAITFPSIAKFIIENEFKHIPLIDPRRIQTSFKISSIDDTSSKVNNQIFLKKNVKNQGLNNVPTHSGIDDTSSKVNNQIFLKKNVKNQGLNNVPTHSGIDDTSSKVNDQTFLKKNVKNQGLNNVPTHSGIDDTSSKVNDQTFLKKNVKNQGLNNVPTHSDIDEIKYTTIPHWIFYVITSVCSFGFGWLASKVTKKAMQSTTGSTKDPSLTKNPKPTSSFRNKGDACTNKAPQTIMLYLNEKEDPTSFISHPQEQPDPSNTRRPLPSLPSHVGNKGPIQSSLAPPVAKGMEPFRTIRLKF